MTRTLFLLPLFAALFLTSCERGAENAAHSPLRKTAVDSSKNLSTENSACGNTRIIRLTQKQIDFARIKTEPVRLSHLWQDLEFSSVVQSPSDDVGVISPQISGVVSRVLVDLGDNVRKGQVLIYVDSPDLAEAQSNYFNAVSKVEEVKAQTRLLQTRLNIANQHQNRLNGLLGEGISAKRDVEAAEEKVASTSAELVALEAAGNAAEAQLNGAKVRLAALGILHPGKAADSFTTILPLYSPCDGTVVERNVVAGQAISPISASSSPRGSLAQQGALISIANLKTVWVMLEVPQAQVSKLKLNSPVKFVSEVAPGVTFDGKITRLGENFDPTCHCVMVRSEIDNRKNLLKPGMLVIAKVHTDKKKSDGLIIRSAAIQNIEGQDYVFVARDRQSFEKLPIKKLSTVEENALISGAVKPGDQLVCEGSFLLKTEVMKTLLDAGREK